MTDKASNYLGIMRKAGALAIGEVESGAAVKCGKAVLLCLASDASDNAQHRAEGFVYQRNTPLIRLPYEKETIAHLLGKRGCSMISLLDPGFASAFVSALADADAEQYAAVAQRLKEQTDRAKARQSSARNGKRRNNV